MADQPTPSAVDRINLTLGALAATLAAAILSVLFVGTGDPPPSGATSIVSQPTTSVNQPTTTVATESVTVPPSSLADVFVMPATLTGNWRSNDGATVARFGPGVIEALQSIAEVDGESVSLVLENPGALGGVPTASQPIQAVLYLTAESDTLLRRAQPVLVEFLATDEGLRLIFEVSGTMVEEHLRPSS